MKLKMKLAIALVFVTALVMTLVSTTSGVTLSPCPPVHCPQVLDGYLYIGTCSNDVPGQTCLGWVYEKYGQQCHVPALGGL